MNSYLNAYMKAYSYLRVYPEKQAVELRIASLEEELANKDKEIAELKTNGHQKTDEIEAVQKRLQELEQKEADRLERERLREIKNQEFLLNGLDQLTLKQVEKILSYNPNRIDLLTYVSKRRTLESKQQLKKKAKSIKS